MVDLVSSRELEHDWKDYDEHHKACMRCGLRLFWTERTAYGQRGWVLVDHDGVTSPNLLTQSSGFGRCDPPREPPIAETVIIDYTGDPDVHPSCERFMHRVPHAKAGALLDVRGLVPACGYRATWWELGPARDHVGWTWCLDCWGRGRTRPRLEEDPRARRAPASRYFSTMDPRALKGKP